MVERQAADMEVPLVGRIERAAQEADAKPTDAARRARHGSDHLPPVAPKPPWIGNRMRPRSIPDAILLVMDYRKYITLESGKRGGKPCIRGMRITVYDVLGWLASGMSEDAILDDFPDLTRDDIKACLAFAADRERQTTSIVA